MGRVISMEGRDGMGDGRGRQAGTGGVGRGVDREGLGWDVQRGWLWLFC